MNNKITFPRLSTLLADQSGRSKRFSEDFLREFFSIISEKLEAGESVKIKGFGTFRLSRVEPRKSVDVTTGEPMEISGHSKVVFVPSKELAAAVNAPFEAFTAIEISDNVDISQLLSKEDSTEDKSDIEEINSLDIIIDNSKGEEHPFEEDVIEKSPDKSEVVDFAISEEVVSEETIPDDEITDESAIFNVVQKDETSIEALANSGTQDKSQIEIEPEIANLDSESSLIEEIEDNKEFSSVEETEATDTPLITEVSEDFGEIRIESEGIGFKSEIEAEEREGLGIESEVKTYKSEDIGLESEVKADESEVLENDSDDEENETESIEIVSQEIEQPEIIDTKIDRWKNWKKGLLVGLTATIIALFSTFVIWYIYATNDFNKKFDRTAIAASTGDVIAEGNQQQETDYSDNNPLILEDTLPDNTESIETEAEVPTAPSDAVVYDTISTTRYLTTMAKSHYGNYNLWPYIYEENKAKLGHPDRIRPGTPVVIPKLSKYGVDPKNAADIEKAKKMGVEIYARYGKKI